MHNSKNYLASDLPFRKSQIIPSRNLHAFYTYFHWDLVISKNQKPIILIKTFIVWSENKKAAWFFFVWTMVLNLFKRNKIEYTFCTFIFVYSPGRTVIYKTTNGSLFAGRCLLVNSLWLCSGSWLSLVGTVH